jgi:hypothetical protein
LIKSFIDLFTIEASVAASLETETLRCASIRNQIVAMPRDFAGHLRSSTPPQKLTGG